MGARRWVTEEQVLEEMERLNDMSLQAVREYEDAAQAAANAEANYKRLRAKAVLRLKALHGIRGIGEAEYHADADDEVATALMERLTTAATADAIRERLRSIRTNQDSLRTAAASNRAPVAGA